jgi:hypothetical protein
MQDYFTLKMTVSLRFDGLQKSFKKLFELGEKLLKDLN